MADLFLITLPLQPFFYIHQHLTALTGLFWALGNRVYILQDNNISRRKRNSINLRCNSRLNLLFCSICYHDDDVWQERTNSD